MQSALHLKATVLPGGKIEVTDQALQLLCPILLPLDLRPILQDGDCGPVNGSCLTSATTPESPALRWQRETPC